MKISINGAQIGRMAALAVTTVAGVLFASLLAAPASAATDRVMTADFCSVDAFTDVVDRTIKVYGSGSMICRAQNYHIRLYVTLYRDGSPISTAVCEEQPSYDGTCDTSTTVTDNWEGNQRWQTRAWGQYRDSRFVARTVTAWSNTLYH